MPNNYYDMTGFLVLDKVTPVIEAFFGPLKVDSKFPGNGEAYICIQSEDNEGSWANVLNNLRGLVKNLRLAVLAKAEDTMEAHLALLATHFGTELDHCFLSVEDMNFTADPEAEELFSLALLFDDGHGLKALKTEAAYTCSEPLLFEFGGVGEFIGQHFKTQTTSMAAVDLGPRLDDALAAGDFTKVTGILQDEVERLLMGINDLDASDKVRQMLGECLVANLGAGKLRHCS